MAITSIHAIEGTPSLALEYVRKDKVEDYISDAEIPSCYSYHLFEKEGKEYIQFQTLNTYQNCNADDPMSSYKRASENGRGKLRNETPRTKSGSEIVMWHLVQSFSDNITPVLANKIGLKLAKEVFGNFTVTISTHTNTDNIHNHLIISAWDMDGRKWHDCHATKRQIRSASDNLCRKYNLQVLEDTKDMRLVKYKDKSGITRYFEPTERKRQLSAQRKNTEKLYKEQKEKLTSYREQIKCDIDTLLPYVSAYEELLERLRNIGYTIRSHKKDGSLLVHVSFRAPQQNKATRDSSLGDDMFYQRESLAAYITSNKAAKGTNNFNQRDNESASEILYFENYDYLKGDLERIDGKYRATKSSDDRYKVVERTFTEKMIISNIQIKDSGIKGLVDTTELYKVISAQENKSPKKYQIQQFVTQIQNSFQCLHYTEQHNIFSYQQIFDLYKNEKDKLDKTVHQISQIDITIKHLNKMLYIPRKAAILESRIENSKHNAGYILEEYHVDKKLLSEYQTILQKYEIDTTEGLSSFTAKIAEFEGRQQQIQLFVASTYKRISELENCMNTFARIDKENGKQENFVVTRFKQLFSEKAHTYNSKKATHKERSDR